MPRYVDNTMLSVNYDTDVKRRIISVDSRFREDVKIDPTVRLANPTSDRVGSVANFKYRLPVPVRNIIRMKVLSMELPNTAYATSAAKKNNTFILTTGGTDYTIVLPNGSYEPINLPLALETAFTAAGVPGTATIGLNADTTKIQIGLDAAFSVTFRSATLGWPNRPYDWGLGYDLGFRTDTQTAVDDGTGTYYLTPESVVDMVGDNYYFLQVNNENAVEHNTTDNGQVEALAKILVTVGSNTITFDQYPGLLTHAVSFRNPTDIGVLQVRLVDAYGQIVDLNDIPFSFSLELTEVLNTYLYESNRKHIGWNPANA